MRKFFAIIGLAFICIISFGTFFGLARGTINDLAGFEFRSVNEANYVNVEDYTLTKTEDKDAALQVTYDEDGVISIKGKNDTEAIQELVVTAVTLEKGDYEVLSHAKGCGEKTYHLELRDAADGVIIADEEFSIDDTTVFTVVIVIEAGADIDTEFSPVIVNKGEKTSFFVDNWNIFNN